MNADKLKTRSKFLSLVLRHKPETIGLELDENGWADVKELLRKAAAHGRVISPEMLREIVNTNDKQRFSFNEDGSRIRANQGHSVDIELGLEPVDPPDVLFHGTATRFLEAIMKKGLIPGNRQHVHLSKDVETATNVGGRHGKVVVLKVDAKRLHAEGHKFYVSANGVWLTDQVPTDALTECKRA